MHEILKFFFEIEIIFWMFLETDNKNFMTNKPSRWASNIIINFQPFSLIGFSKR